MCDTMVAVGNATADGTVILAKNSDRQPNEAQQEETARFQDIWSIDTFVISKGILNVSEMRPHASRLLRIISS